MNGYEINKVASQFLKHEDLNINSTEKHVEKGLVLEEWDTEPNEFLFEHKGLKCLILRVERFGHLCGYVGVSGLSNDYDEDEIDVHGCVTFDSAIEDCHLAIREHFDVFDGVNRVIGFDSAHYMDIVPLMENIYNKHLMGGTYKNMAFMKEETTRLAEQLLVYTEATK